MHFTSKTLKPSGIKTVRKKVAFSGDGRGTRFVQSTWSVCRGGQETEGRNEVQMNKELRAKSRGGGVPYISYINQTDCRADTTAKGFIWANISTSTTSLLQGQSYNEKN